MCSEVRGWPPWRSGFLSGLWALYLKFVDGISFIQTPLPLLVMFSGLTGIVCFLMGLLAEMLTRIYHESQDKPTYLIRRTQNIPSKT